MRIPPREIPQADVLEDVIGAALAVGQGDTTFQAISSAIGKVQRQGRYYRLAAELLGLIAHVGPNRSQLTERGRQLAEADAGRRHQLVAESVLGLRLMQRVVPFLEARAARGCTRGELERFIRAITERTGPTMVPRRTSTVISWLQSAGLLNRVDERYHLQSAALPAGAVEYSSDEEPLLPARYDLAEYTNAARRATRTRPSIQDNTIEAKRERQDGTHEALTDLVATKISECGAVPRRNSYIDLAARVSGKPYIFEVKTTTPTNTRMQIRRGIAQLYEYRYIQGTPSARLVLVLQHPVPRDLHWTVEYLSEDRGIVPVWDGDMRTLHCDRRHRNEISFLL
jgi:hypothetical protein